MKEIKLYVCEKCGAQYSIEENAKKCEQHHIESVEIVKEKFLPYNISSSGYPIKLSVRMSDGKIITYRT